MLTAAWYIASGYPIPSAGWLACVAVKESHIYTSGIHAAELHGDDADDAADDGEPVPRLDSGALERLFAKYGVAPTWTTRAFTW